MRYIYSKHSWMNFTVFTFCEDMCSVSSMTASTVIVLFMLNYDSRHVV